MLLLQPWIYYSAISMESGASIMSPNEKEQSFITWPRAALYIETLPKMQPRFLL